MYGFDAPNSLKSPKRLNTPEILSSTEEIYGQSCLLMIPIVNDGIFFFYEIHGLENYFILITKYLVDLL